MSLLHSDERCPPRSSMSLIKIACFVMRCSQLRSGYMLCRRPFEHKFNLGNMSLNGNGYVRDKIDNTIGSDPS